MGTPNTQILDRHNAAALIGGKSLSMALRTAILDDPEVQAVVKEGESIPEGEIEWLDALRNNALPSVFWAVNNDYESFSAQDLVKYSIEFQMNATLELKDFDHLNKMRYDEIMNVDKFTKYRYDFHDKIQQKFRLIMFLLQSGFLNTEGELARGDKNEIIDPDFWYSNAAIHLTDNYMIVDSKTLYKNIYFTKIEKNLGDNYFPITKEQLKLKGKAGAKFTYNWPRAVVLLVATLVDDGIPPPGTEILYRLKNKMLEDGWGDKIPESKTIDNAMQTRVGAPWDFLRKTD